MSIILDYIRACRFDLSTLFFILMVTSSLFMILINLWLSEWSNQALLVDTHLDKVFYMSVYFILGLSQCNNSLLIRIFNFFFLIY